MPSPLSASELIAALQPATLEAGRLILDIRDKGFDVEHKDDHSPVTEADQAAEAILLKALKSVENDAVIVAEESASNGILPTNLGWRFWLIDPLDGTKEFIKGGSDFTVNIGLIENGRPTLGLVYAPAQNRLFSGVRGVGAFEENMKTGEKHQIRTRAPQINAIDAVASKSHRDAETDAFLEQFEIANLKSAGSSLKFCLVATGEADLYPRFGPTMEWDTGAGQAIVEAAGGYCSHPDGKSFNYAKTDFRNGPFIVVGDKLLLEQFQA